MTMSVDKFAFDHVSLEFIRHAQSKFNVAREQWSKDNPQHTRKEQHDWSDSYNLYMSKPEYIDAAITKLGEQQASKIKKKYDLLILSPMHRCIQTYKCSQIETKEIIICDLFREAGHNICDFMQHEIDAFQLENIKSKVINKDINKNYDKLIYFQREKNDIMIKRVKMAKIYLKHLIQQRTEEFEACTIANIDSNKSNDKLFELKIGVVTHRAFIDFFTSDVDPKTNEFLFNGISIKNATVLEYDIKKLM